MALVDDQEAIASLFQEYEIKQHQNAIPFPIMPIASEPVKTKLKGIRVNVFRNAAHGYDCTNKGLSSQYATLTLVGDGIPEIDEEREDAPAIAVKVKNVYRKQHIYCEPVSNPADKHYMFGGNYVLAAQGTYKCFGDLGCSPLPVHDRQE